MGFRGILAAAVVIGILCAGPALGDEMPFALTTTGAFSGLPAGANLAFSGNSASGIVGPSGVASNINLGAFTLTPPTTFDYLDYAGGFNLNVTFAVPVEAGSNSFTASISGRVNKRNGSISINFTPDTRLFTFSNAEGSGSFNLNVSDVFGFAPGRTTATRVLYGTITDATFTPASGGGETPEPSTLVLMVSSVLGAVLLRRKKTASRV